MFQHPIYPLIITFFTLVLAVIQSIQNEKVLKYRMVLAFFNISMMVVAMVLFYQSSYLNVQPYENIYIGYTFFLYFIFLLVLYTTLKTASLKANHYQLFVKSIKNSRWNVYYVVDKKERIKDMSVSLLQELNLEKEDVIGKKLFSIFNKTIRFTSINQTEINNKLLEGHYFSYRDSAQPGDSDIEELTMLNAFGEQMVLHFVMQPVFVFGKYKGRVCVGEKKTNFDLLKVEKELNETNSELESIRHKFIATLDISNEGLFYIDLDEKIFWASDSLVNMLGLPKNEMDLTDFRRRIEPEDLKKYLSVLGDLTYSKSIYRTSFRVLVDNHYQWFQEKGKRLFEDQTGSFIMGTLNPLKTKHFKASNIDELDSLKDQNDLLVKTKQLFQENRYFQLCVVNLKSIPKINERHGREIGNLMMAEYIKNLRKTFVTENGDIYRISGLEFVVLITDARKMDVLASGIKSNKEFLNLAVNYGSIQDEIQAYMGIAVGGSDAHDEYQLYQAAVQALKIAENPQFERNGCYYRDIV